MSKTKIEWANWSINPIRTKDSGYHCTKVSSGCANCYAERFNTRFGNRKPFDDAPVEYILDEKPFLKLVRAKKSKRVFLQSMGDICHEGIPKDMVNRILGWVALLKQHTFIVPTKRPERMKELLNNEHRHEIVWMARDQILDEYGSRFPDRFHKRLDLTYWDQRASGYEYLFGFEPGPEWPLANLWVGVSVETQETADVRVPLLLDTTASVRFVSVEPMLGPIKLEQWILPRTPFTPDDAPGTWADYKWPDWVPQKVRSQIEDFWSASSFRGPKNWAENAIQNDSPPFGMKMVYEDRSGKRVVGKWVFAWNNMGRLIADNGEVYCPSIPRSHLLDTKRYYWHDLHWVIVGGETGPNARPLHLDWVRDLREQCVAAGVPFFFKGWGNWAVTRESHDPECDLTALAENEEVMASKSGWIAVAKVGKHRSGRNLDGRTWDEVPGTQTKRKTRQLESSTPQTALGTEEKKAHEAYNKHYGPSAKSKGGQEDV